MLERIVGIAVLALASLVIVWSFATVAIARRRDGVAQTGPYRFLRHPIYATYLPAFVGLALLLNSWWILVAIPVSLLVCIKRGRREELWLHKNRPDYAAYAARTPSIIPRFRR
jgi:protein-S-isoprenylcysteine O-methyltransferase Ste14